MLYQKPSRERFAPPLQKPPVEDSRSLAHDARANVCEMQKASNSICAQADFVAYKGYEGLLAEDRAYDSSGNHGSTTHEARLSRTRVPVKPI